MNSYAQKTCLHDPPKYIPGEPWVKDRDCRVCWLYHNDPVHQEAIDNLSDPRELTEEEKEQRKVERQELSLKKRIATWANAMKREMEWRAGGGSAPSPEEKAKRRTICDGCEERDVEQDLCKKCGCYLEAGWFPPRPLGKLDCASQACPLRLWGTTGGAKPAGCPNSK